MNYSWAVLGGRNDDRGLIRKSDIPDIDPIGFFVQGDLIGSPNLESRDPKNRNQFELKHEEYKNGFMVEFSHIAFRDTCQIQFFHTFLDEPKITISGSIIGYGKPEKGKFIGAIDAALTLFDTSLAYLVYFFAIIVFAYIQDKIARRLGIDPANICFFSPSFSFEEFFRFSLMSIPIILVFGIFSIYLIRIILENRSVGAIRKKTVSLFMKFFL